MQILDVQLFERFERAGRVTDDLGGDMGVTGGGAQFGMAEQDLDHPHVDICFQKVGCEAVAQRVQSCGL